MTFSHSFAVTSIITKKIKVLYFGDFNPSGLHAPMAIQSTMSKLKNAWKSEFKSKFENIEFDRIALRLEDIEKYDLPENPTKKKTHKDKVLAERFIKKYGDRNVELDSLAEHKPAEFKKQIRDSIEKHLDQKIKLQAEKREAIVIPKLEKIISNMSSNYFRDNWNINLEI